MTRSAPHRVGMVFMLGLTALVAAAFVFARSAPAPAAVGDQLLPDLVTAAPSGLSIANVKRKTKELRFNYSAENAGVGVLELTSRIEDCDGDGVVSNDRTAIQRIFKDADGNGYFTRGTDTAFDTQTVGCFVFHPKHHHWHLEDFARYELRDSSGGLVGSTDKVSFCLGDNFHTNPGLQGSPASAYFADCTRDSDQGISIGWTDIYGAQLEGQAITLGGSADGTFCLVQTADPLNHIAESNESNNRAAVQVTISGTTVTPGGSC
jgi:lysyl oxidase